MKGLYGQFACAMPRDTRMVAAGPLGRLVYMEASLYCRENLTNGVIERAQLSFWTPDVTRQQKVKLLDLLAELGALEIIDVGWRIPWRVWCEWNPTKEQVEEKRRQEAERKAEWRAKRTAQSATCPDDVPMGQERLSQRCPTPVPDSQRQRQSQSHKPETEPSITPSRSLRPAANELGEVIKGLFGTVEEAAS